MRSPSVPLAMGMTLAGWIGISIWLHSVSVLGAIVLCCAAFASWVRWKLPRARG